MVRGAVGAATVLAAWVLASSCGSGATGLRLEEQLGRALAARGGRVRRDADGARVSCRYESDDGDRDRFCEAGQSRAQAPLTGCACREVCHVWGDPHLAPFFDSCSAHVMNEEGWHTLWSLPARGGGEPGMLVEGLVERDRGKHWIKRLRVDGDEVMAVDANCQGQRQGERDNHSNKNKEEEQDDGRTFERGSRMLRSDAALAAGEAADTKVEWTAFCDWRKGVASLEVKLAVEQAQSPFQAKRLSAGRPGAPPETTAMFAADSGLCTNPGGRFACERPSLIKAARGQDGRECTCNAQCSVFGDPNVHDFFQVQARRGGDSFKMPAERELAASDFHVGRVLYMMDQRFAVYAQMNACEHIERVHVLVNKRFDAALPADQCRPIGWDPEPAALSLDDFEVLEYDANDLCTEDHHFSSASRKAVVFPHGANESRFLDEELGGLDLGYYGAFAPDDATAGAYRAAQVARATDLEACPVPSGAKPRFASFLDMGGVRVTMKCHRTRQRRRARSTAFFNVCVERLDVREGVTRGGGALLSDRAFAEAERTLLTSGHCALGEPRFADVAAGRYAGTEHRALNEFNLFTIVDNSAAAPA